MSISTEAKFNSGNGGVMVTISRETGRFGMGGVEEVVEASELLSPHKAIDLALELIHKAANSVPDELDAAIRDLKSQRGMW